jgi:hypothetical protein
MIIPSVIATFYGWLRGEIMRALLLGSLFCILTLFPHAGKAGDRLAPVVVSGSEWIPANPNSETYRGHFFDLSALAGRQDFSVMATALRRQIDMVEGVVGLSPHMLEFFRTIPISVNEVACLTPSKNADGKDLEDPKALLHAACYVHEAPRSPYSISRGSVWDSSKSRWTNSDPVALAEDTKQGVVLVRPIALAAPDKYAQRPVMLHELLHAYHDRIMPQGFRNSGILLHYNLAKSGQLYPGDAYLLTNEREFFAVTSSVFLYGNDGPISRANVKEKQPEYYKYLVNLFGFDPEPEPRKSPLASAQ